MLLVQLPENQKSLLGIKVYPELSVISAYRSTGIKNYLHHLLFQWWETFYLQMHIKGSFLTLDLTGRFNLLRCYLVASIALSKTLCSACDKDCVY